LNYLAHIFLSGADGRVQVGNFIGDAVKGSAYKNYPPPIARGILLHRAIDDYTDNHAAVRTAVRMLRPRFGRYAGALLDIYFDYLLASHFGEFSRVPLKRYTRRFYWAMIRNRRYLPDRIRRFMWHFISTNRLGKYASAEGIRESVGIMARYGRMRISADEAVAWLLAHEGELWAVFRPFFDELQTVCRECEAQNRTP
jgi:acyl carrier protein phosphodiesterase